MNLAAIDTRRISCTADAWTKINDRPACLVEAGNSAAWNKQQQRTSVLSR